MIILFFFKLFFESIQDYKDKNKFTGRFQQVCRVDRFLDRTYYSIVSISLYLRQIDRITKLSMLLFQVVNTFKKIFWTLGRLNFTGMLISYLPKFKFILLFLILLIYSCSEDNSKDIRDYYFPLKQLKEGMVYEYEAIQPDSLSPQYWYYRTIMQDGQVFLTGTMYEADFVPRQLVKEELVENGMLLDDLFIYYSDSTNKQQSYDIQIVAGNAFPFQVSLPSGIFLYNIHWEDPIRQTTTTLIKNRRYLGDTTLTMAGRQFDDCIAFGVKELVEVESEGVLAQEFEGVEIYAKGTGLVYFKKIISSQLTLEYLLADRYPMDTLLQYEQHYRESLQ